MFRRLASYALASYFSLFSSLGLAQEPPRTTRFSTGLELNITEDAKLKGDDLLCFPYIEARKKKGMRLPLECEFYDPNQSQNPLLEVAKEDLDRKISAHYTVGDFARIGKQQQLRYARKGDYWEKNDEFFNKYIRVDLDLVQRVERLCDITGTKLPIIDGFRSFGYNTRMYWALGKIPTSSYHNSGKAVDVRVSPRKVGAVLQQLFEHDGIGFGRTFIHIDTRGTKARWYYHLGKKKRK